MGQAGNYSNKNTTDNGKSWFAQISRRELEKRNKLQLKYPTQLLQHSVRYFLKNMKKIAKESPNDQIKFRNDHFASRQIEDNSKEWKETILCLLHKILSSQVMSSRRM